MLFFFSFLIIKYVWVSISWFEHGFCQPIPKHKNKNEGEHNSVVVLTLSYAQIIFPAGFTSQGVLDGILLLG
jgi:hypothetical protein